MRGFSQITGPRTSVVVTAPDDGNADGHRASRWARTPPGFRIMKEAHA